MSKQTHIFATRCDLEPGLKEFESKREVKYARCGLYCGPAYDRYFSLLDWTDLGKNATGDHISGPRFLVVPRECKINVECVPQVGGVPNRSSVDRPIAWVCDSTGGLSRQAASFEEYVTKLESASGSETTKPTEEMRYDLSQKLNPDSITFLPGGIYNGEKILICGHIGTISDSPTSRDLYKAFVRHVVKGFEKIGSYYVGPEAVRSMNEGYRMVTIGITSPVAYDLRRSL